nr:IclR family transcriptional regulator [Geotalea uraniireducens]
MKRTMKMNRKTNYIIRSVCHALDVLEQFHGDDAELGVSDLSRRLQLPKNNVFRLLATLEHRNYVEQNRNTENYRLGLKTMEMGQMVIRQMGHLGNVRPIMEALVKECNETLCLSILKDFQNVNLDVIEGDNPLRFVPRIGEPLPAYCTSAGKVQIAHLAEEKLKLYIADCQFQRYTLATITDPKLLLRHLRQISQQGYAIESEELEDGARSVAAPVRDYTSNIIGAIAFYGPSTRFIEERMEKELIPLVLKGAREISAMLGHSRNGF